MHSTISTAVGKKRLPNLILPFQIQSYPGEPFTAAFSAVQGALKAVAGYLISMLGAAEKSSSLQGGGVRKETAASR